MMFSNGMSNEEAFRLASSMAMLKYLEDNPMYTGYIVLDIPALVAQKILSLKEGTARLTPIVMETAKSLGVKPGWRSLQAFLMKDDEIL